jgi:hypothetical protein
MNFLKNQAWKYALFGVAVLVIDAKLGGKLRALLAKIPVVGPALF